VRVVGQERLERQSDGRGVRVRRRARGSGGELRRRARADCDVAKEAEARIVGEQIKLVLDVLKDASERGLSCQGGGLDLRLRANTHLDLRVVGRDAVADEAVGRRQPLVDVHL
jgi:hypothetical protein